MKNLNPPEVVNKLTHPKPTLLNKLLSYIKVHRVATVAALGIVLLAIVFIVFLGLHHARPKTTQNTSANSNNTPTQPVVSTNPLFGVPCKDNPKPVFSHDLTDSSLIDHIQVYGLGESTPRFRSFLWINTAKTAKVPVYAPVDSDLVEGVYKNARGAIDFDIHMMVSCQVWYLVNHITDPVDKIRQALPSTPATNTMDPPRISPTVHFSAGELLGYTGGTPLPHNWDFGVFDLTHANQFTNQARYTQDKYGKIQTAICPFDIFPDVQKAAYYSLFGETQPVPGAKCGPLSPDKAGTISGSWFDTASPGQDPQLHFKLMIGIYNDGVIRVSGEDFQPPIEITPANPTYQEPLAVTTRHCYVSGNQRVDFLVVSDQQIKVYSDIGSCSTAFPASGFKTYYR